MIDIQYPIQNLVIHFRYLMFTYTILDQEKQREYNVPLNMKNCKYRRIFLLFHIFYFDCSFRKSNLYIYHVVWYCDTCLSVVYGNRAQNSSIIQLYEIQTLNTDNDKILHKTRFTEETRKGALLTRFLKPFFSPKGNYGFIIRFDPLNIDKVTQKSYPYIVRIHFNQQVC